MLRTCLLQQRHTFETALKKMTYIIKQCNFDQFNVIKKGTFIRKKNLLDSIYTLTSYFEKQNSNN